MNTIGLDISQKTIDATLKKSDGSAYHIKISNDSEGFQKLKAWIKTNRVRKTVIGMEATGIYYEAAADTLSETHTVYVINPLKIKNYAESQFSRTKTDKADSNLIAEYTKRHIDKLTAYRKPDNRYLQKLLSLKNQLKEQQKQIKNRLHSSESETIKTIHEDLIQTYQEKIDQAQTAIEAEIDRQEDKNTHYRNLQTISGIGKETAAILYAQLTDKNFQTANKFISYIGLSPQIQQSGTSVNKKGKLSRYGHRRLKSALYMPALVAYRTGAFPQLVRNLINAGKHKMIIIVAIMRKLAKLAYYIVKTGKPYDATRHKSAA
ncbi:IS110 family RNA-guided transposase [Neisseria mucosa]|uniref:IS110 family transposase n=1 Tax=Neisseria mucosa TaxID=488 RepID=UPI0027E006CC|nr:IS110 family transposase [Neisseria mucosa]